MADLIDRQAAIDAVKKAYDRESIESGWLRSFAIRAINGVPSVQQWIPCSERLPEYYDAVLTWDGDYCTTEMRIPCIRGDDGEPIESEWWVSAYYEEGEYDYYPGLRDGTAIAWMPLPEPYKGKGRKYEV